MVDESAHTRTDHAAEAHSGVPTPLGKAIDLPEFFRILRRRKAIIFGSMLVLMTFSVFVIFQLAPQYTATSTVMIPSRTTQIIDVEAVLSGLSYDQATIESEREVIRSGELVTKVVRELALDRDPEFNPVLRPPPPLAWLIDPLQEAMASLKTAITDESEPPALIEAEQDDTTLTRVVNTLLDKLLVQQVGRSRVLKVSFQSENPRTAANIANKVVELYIGAQLEAKSEAIQRANQWLSKRLVDLREKVLASERMVEDFRQRSGLIQGRDTTLALQEISELNAQLLEAQAKRVDAEARIMLVRDALASEDGIESITEVLESSLIQALRREEIELDRQAAELSQHYGERHPKMITVRAEIEDLHQKIRTEIGRIIQGLRNEVTIARITEVTLTRNLGRLKAEVGELNQADVQLRTLEREAEANRQLYETFLARSKETSNQDDFQEADVQIVSRASVPPEPSHPKTTLLLVVSFVGSGFIGLLLAFTMEHMSSGIHSLEEVEQYLGVAPLGLIPVVRGTWWLGKSLQTYVVEKPTSAYAESIRNLYANLVLPNYGERSLKVILVTSALPREGKTSVALAMGRLVAASGKSVVIVDADLRRPTAHKLLGVQLKPGFAEYVRGEATLPDVVRQDPRSPLHAVPAGAVDSAPATLIRSEQVRTLLLALSAAYDLVIVDSAPIFAIADTRILSKHVDNTILIVRWRKTRRANVIHALRQLAHVGSDVGGVALSMVDVKKHARYGHGDSGYYFGEFQKYYRN